ncbi:MAG: enoyl-CoA hydratase/isomerase family protein [Hyphomicrobiaceae bacterium]
MPPADDNTELDASEVLIRREGRAGRITLNRPRAINALRYEMVAPIYDALAAWQSDPNVALVILDGAGDRGLCAGGDVVSLYHSRVTEGSGLARRFWSDEYRLNALIGRYPKPFVAVQDGIVMGGGIGLSGHASHRIVTERSMLAMPETAIGLIPDVGGTWLLAHAPGEIGVYLGLTGHRMNAGDALYANFADTCVSAASLPGLIETLSFSDEPISVAIAAVATAPAPSPLAEHRGEIDSAFAASTVEAIRDRLASMPGEFAARQLKDLASRSPSSLKATLAAIRNARTLPSLEAALAVEYRLTVRLFEAGEFPEGVRALLIDKDRKPAWKPPRLEDLHQGQVDALFAPLPAGEDWRASPA